MSANIQCKIQGSVAPGFESVKQLYEHNMRHLAEKATQLCIYHEGEKVVDLWATTEKEADFSPDNLINVFSSGKSLTAIAMATLVGKGLLNYDDKITQHWPEFGGAGKDELSVCDLMRHEAGLAAFNQSIKPEDLLTENIKTNVIGKLIEGHAQKFRKGDGRAREYHAVTRGWIANEIFRRVDPKDRTISEFLQEDISDPLEVDVVIGVKKDELNRVKKISTLGLGFILLESLKPKFRRKTEFNIFQILRKVISMLFIVRKSTTIGSPPPFKGMKKIEFFNDPKVVMGETPSANANCSARGLAKIAAMMAAGGTWDEKEYFSSEAWAALHEGPVKADMGFVTTTFTQGGLALFTECDQNSTQLDRAINTGREGFYGWMGLGGSLFQWHPKHKIGFAYVPTSLNVIDIVNERGKAYQTEVLKCVADIGR